MNNKKTFSFRARWEILVWWSVFNGTGTSLRKPPTCFCRIWNMVLPWLDLDTVPEVVPKVQSVQLLDRSKAKCPTGPHVKPWRILRATSTYGSDCKPKSPGDRLITDYIVLQYRVNTPYNSTINFTSTKPCCRHCLQLEVWKLHGHTVRCWLVVVLWLSLGCPYQGPSKKNIQGIPRLEAAASQPLP